MSGRLFLRYVVPLLLWSLPLYGFHAAATSGRAEDAANATPAVVEVPESVKSGLVLIEVVDADGKVRQLGTGVVVEQGIVATNLSSLRRGERLLVGWSDGRAAPAEGVLAFDRELDVALVKLSLPADHPVPPLKIRTAPNPGESFQFVGLTAMREIVSRPAAIVERPTDPAPEDHLVCDAPLPVGCEAGAWFGADGHLLGMWTWSARYRSGETLGIPGQVLKNMLRRQQERVPLTLAELRRKLNTLTGAWGPLYPSRKLAPSKVEKGQQLPVFRDDIRFTGPKPGDVFHLGEYRTQGGWRISERLLTAPPDSAVTLRIATAEAFQLEIDADASAPGGWFILMGADDRNGYVLSNVTLKQSGSPWLLCELRDGLCNPDSYRELGRATWKGMQRLGLSVAGNSRGEYRLEATLNGRPLFDATELPAYTAGDIVLGTYLTRYGAKPVRIQSIRGKVR